MELQKNLTAGFPYKKYLKNFDSMQRSAQTLDEPVPENLNPKKYFKPKNKLQ